MYGWSLNVRQPRISGKRFLSPRRGSNLQPSNDPCDTLTIKLPRLRWRAKVQVQLTSTAFAAATIWYQSCSWIAALTTKLSKSARNSMHSPWADKVTREILVKTSLISTSVCSVSHDTSNTREGIWTWDRTPAKAYEKQGEVEFVFECLTRSLMERLNAPFDCFDRLLQQSTF